MFYDKNRKKKKPINVFQIQNYSPQVFSLSQNATRGTASHMMSGQQETGKHFNLGALNSQSEGRLSESSLGAFFTVPFNLKSKIL